MAPRVTAQRRRSRRRCGGSPRHERPRPCPPSSSSIRSAHSGLYSIYSCAPARLHHQTTCRSARLHKRHRKARRSLCSKRTAPARTPTTAADTQLHGPIAARASTPRTLDLPLLPIPPLQLPHAHAPTYGLDTSSNGMPARQFIRGLAEAARRAAPRPENHPYLAAGGAGAGAARARHAPRLAARGSRAHRLCAFATFLAAVRNEFSPHPSAGGRRLTCHDLGVSPYRARLQFDQGF